MPTSAPCAWSTGRTKCTATRSPSWSWRSTAERTVCARAHHWVDASPLVGRHRESENAAASGDSPMSTAAGPLSHVKVLDLSRILAAPWAGQILADLGAEVI